MGPRYLISSFDTILSSTVFVMEWCITLHARRHVHRCAVRIVLCQGKGGGVVCPAPSPEPSPRNKNAHSYTLCMVRKPKKTLAKTLANCGWAGVWLDCRPPPLLLRSANEPGPSPPLRPAAEKARRSEHDFRGDSKTMVPAPRSQNGSSSRDGADCTSGLRCVMLRAGIIRVYAVRYCWDPP